MPTINKETGSITYDNTAIKMQERIEGDDLYSPLYPRELASNIKWNENTLTLPNETGNSTYETKYRALDFVYGEQYLFALNNCIYKYIPSTKTLSRIYYFYQELENDYFVDISMRTGTNNSTFYLISANGKIYSFPANKWFDTELTECTGIVYTNNQMLVTTKHGLYVSDWDNSNDFDFVQTRVADFDNNTEFSIIDIMIYQGQQQLLVIAANHSVLGAVSTLATPTTFVKVSNDVSKTYHQYKNIIPQLNLVVCVDGIWNTFGTSVSYFNSSDLRNLKDTQYIYYIKKWSSSHYECSNNKWNMTVGYNGSGNIISSAAYSEGAPLYVLFPTTDNDWCLTINNNGKVYHTTETESGTSVYSVSCGNISLTTYRAPRYNYHVDIGDGSKSTQGAMQLLNDSMVQDGRMFDEIPNIPFTFANYINRSDLTSEPIISESGMQCLYNAQTMDTYIYKDNKWIYVNIIDKFTTGEKQASSLNSNFCWHNDELWGIMRITITRGGGSAQANLRPWVFRYNPINDSLTTYNITVGSFENVSPLAGWSITVNSDNIVLSIGWIYPEGDDDADSVSNFGIYSTAYTNNLDTASWTKVQLSSNLNEYTAVKNLQSVKINGGNIVYAISTTGYDGDTGRVSRLISNILMSTCSSDVLGKSTYQYISPIKVGKINGNDTAMIPEYLGVRYTTDFTNVSIKNLDNDMSCPKVEYLSQHSKWIVYEGSTDAIAENTIQYQYQILDSQNLSLLNELGAISLFGLTSVNDMMCSSMTPWVYEQDATYINICSPNGMVGNYTLTVDNKLTFNDLIQTCVDSNYITLQKVIKGVDKYILLYTYNTNNNYIVKSSAVVYSSDGKNWYGGYNLDGYYNDMCYGNGQLWVGGWTGIDGNTLFIPSIVYSGEKDAGSVDMIDYESFNNTEVDLSIENFLPISGVIYSSIATSGNSVCMINSYGSTSALSRITLELNDYPFNTSYTKGLVGYCTKIVAGTANSYYYVLNTSTQRFFQELSATTDGWSRGTIGTYDALPGMFGQVSEYDPVHDGIYITRDSGADIYTQGRFFHIGSINNTSYANQVGWFHGRYLYNILVGSTTKSAYGIVPWFNNYPHDCKYLPMVIKKLCTCGDKCFVISDDNKLYISSAI